MEKDYSQLNGLVLCLSKSCISQTFLFLPQCPPAMKPSVTTSPCYGYRQSNISPKGSHHNHRCTTRARIVLCLYKRFLSVPPRQVIGPLQHLAAPNDNYRHRQGTLIHQYGEGFQCNISILPTLLCYCLVGGYGEKNCMAVRSNNLQ